MESLLQLVEHRFRNAECFRVKRYLLPRFQPIDSLVAETGRWFSALGDDEDNTVDLKRGLWRLRAAAQLTLLPYAAPEVLLAHEAQGIVEFARYYPTLAPRIEVFSTMVEGLLGSQENPKREAVFKLVGECLSAGEKVALVAALTRGKVPGWPQSAVDELKGVFPQLHVVTSFGGLEKDTFDRIVVPGSGRLCSFFDDLHGGGYSSRLSIIAYVSEGVRLAGVRSLPSATFSRRTAVPADVLVQEPAPEPGVAAGDAWVQERFWQSARADAELGVSEERETFVSARLVILANAWSAFLENESKILEVSDVLENGGVEGGEFVQKLPRRSVQDLRPGHLIALRTTRSGGYLVSLADALLRAAKRPKLRIEALEWKGYLLEAVQRYGTARINAILAADKHGMVNHRYMEIWTTDRVIRPESKAVFECLMAALSSLGCLPAGADSARLAKDYWAKMDELLHYHHVAGSRIRDALLGRLRAMIRSGEHIGDQFSITLEGLDAGELSLYRVTDVDTQVLEVPYTQIEVLRPLEG